jgi:hypothetical protein
MNNRDHSALYEPSYQSIDYHNIDEETNGPPYVPHSLIQASKTLKNRQRFMSQRVSTKQNHVITPDSRAQMDSELKVRSGMNATMTNHEK